MPRFLLPLEFRNVKGMHRARLKGHHADVLARRSLTTDALPHTLALSPRSAQPHEPNQFLYSPMNLEPESLRMVQHRDMPANVRAHVYIHVLSTTVARAAPAPSGSSTTALQGWQAKRASQATTSFSRPAPSSGAAPRSDERVAVRDFPQFHENKSRGPSPKLTGQKTSKCR